MKARLVILGLVTLVVLGIQISVAAFGETTAAAGEVLGLLENLVGVHPG